MRELLVPPFRYLARLALPSHFSVPFYGAKDRPPVPVPSCRRPRLEAFSWTLSMMHCPHFCRSPPFCSEVPFFIDRSFGPLIFPMGRSSSFSSRARHDLFIWFNCFSPDFSPDNTLSCQGPCLVLGCRPANTISNPFSSADPFQRVFLLAFGVFSPFLLLLLP